MSIKASIHHLTHYIYDRPVVLGPQVIRLRPAPHSRTRVISHALSVSPAKHFVNHQQDPFGNWLSRFVFPEPVHELKIAVDLVADMTVYNPFDFFIEDTAEVWPFDYPADLTEDLTLYRRADPAGPELTAFLASVPKARLRTVDFIVMLNAMVSGKVAYTIRMEPGVQTPEDTLTVQSGSCRDSSWLLVQAARHLGFAARFVSGYLIQLKPDLKALDGPSGTEVDFTDLHAWAEVYLPGAGWIGLDPTSGLLTGESHIPLAATPHYRSAAPISGLASFAEVKFDFAMTVSRVAEHPRITKPFSDQAWHDLNALGAKVDAALTAGDVRLTMGGEPTFVSIDDFEAEEWNTAAVGPTKRVLADQLIRRLQTRFAPGGFLHYGQGKWYPGETLPRWTFSLYWRRDGKPIWANPDLIAFEQTDAFGRTHCIGVPFTRLEIVNRHECRLSAHGQAHVACGQGRVDFQAKRVQIGPGCIGKRLGDARMFGDAGDRHRKIERDLGKAGEARNRGCVGIMRGRGQRDMRFAGQQAGCGVKADPARAGQVNLGPGMQIGEIMRRPGGAIHSGQVRF